MLQNPEVSVGLMDHLALMETFTFYTFTPSMLLNTTAEHTELRAHFILTAVHDSVKWFINLCASF